MNAQVSDSMPLQKDFKMRKGRKTIGQKNYLQKNMQSKIIIDLREK